MQIIKFQLNQEISILFNLVLIYIINLKHINSAQITINDLPQLHIMQMTCKKQKYKRFSNHKNTNRNFELFVNQFGFSFPSRWSRINVS